MTPADRILGWLREAPTGLSGEEIARRLGCSRAAVFKHVAALRRQGWEIAARHARGYVLGRAPDRLGPAELAAHLTGAWRSIEWLAEVDSTQRVARERARGGAPEGTTVIAEAQTAGRGRLGRTWVSPPGVAFLGSVVLRPPLAPAAVPQVALVAGMAVAAAVRETTGLAATIKWPNDVLVGERKVAGILTEMEAEVDRVHFVICGIGVNVNTPADAFPPELTDRATSLAAALGRPVDRAAFVGRLLAALEARYERFVAIGFGAMRSEWEAYSCLTGRRVTVIAPDGEISGTARGVADDGALRLERDDGGEARIVAGEVTLRDGYGRA
ncbi:MAG: biotin--[acetyl-CoA-carboxylase] ligase [Candidatus Binatia bacterium]